MSWWHMFACNVFGVILFGPAVGTHRFFKTLTRNGENFIQA